jgi:hypothetical protein
MSDKLYHLYLTQAMFDKLKQEAVERGQKVKGNVMGGCICHIDNTVQSAILSETPLEAP